MANAGDDGLTAEFPFPGCVPPTALFKAQINVTLSARKTSVEAHFGRSFRVVAGPRLCVSPRVLRQVPVMVPMSCLPFDLWSFGKVGD